MPDPVCSVGMSRILLVEDDADVRLLLEHVLLGDGHEVDTASSVREADALLDSQTYDLAIADGRLGDGTGMTVAERAADSGAKTLIITGYAFELPKEELGRYQFLLKPVRPSELLEVIGRILHPA